MAKGKKGLTAEEKAKLDAHTALLCAKEGVEMSADLVDLSCLCVLSVIKAVSTLQIKSGVLSVRDAS